MKIRKFCLHPFGTTFDSSCLNLSGRVTRDNHCLVVKFDLIDDRSQVFIPNPKTSTRQDNLWQTTCFEFFIGVQNSPQYWEINLSPSGDWNVYRFEDYRTGMQEERAFSSLPFTVTTSPNHTSIVVALDLTQLNLTQSIDLGITAVIETDQISYWALKHCGKEADFHIRESFAIEL
ncbi:DOMON-like domain-containing protein [Leptolyngbya sp. AN03gr2]|uniref:DOMON-like domain-containing protein n=1 Tax=unclassified Leptolyngbya TaxID=2650499 RepID=UPI003D320D56